MKTNKLIILLAAMLAMTGCELRNTVPDDPVGMSNTQETESAAENTGNENTENSGNPEETTEPAVDYTAYYQPVIDDMFKAAMGGYDAGNVPEGGIGLIEGYGDMLRISTVSENAAVFYSHNNGTGNFLPEVKDGVFVIETEYYMTKESFPTKDTYIMCQMMTTQKNEYIFQYVIRRDGDNISLTRDININATPIYSGTFPDGKWIRIRTVFDYTWGKWFCTYIDENDESYWLAHGSNIPAVISNAGIRSARLTYNVTGNENGKTAQIFTDNFRCYKLNGVTTELEGYKAVKVIADEYSKLPRLTENIYTPAESNAFAEDFSSYKSVPAALSVGNGKWNGAVSGEYIGGIMQVVEAPENPEKRVLFNLNFSFKSSF